LRLAQSATVTVGKILTALVGGVERVLFHPLIADSASAVAYYFDTTTTLANAGAKLLSLRTAGSEKFSVGANGSICNDATNKWLLNGYTETIATPTGYVTVVINGVTYKLVASV